MQGQFSSSTVQRHRLHYILQYMYLTYNYSVLKKVHGHRLGPVAGLRKVPSYYPFYVKTLVSTWETRL